MRNLLLSIAAMISLTSVAVAQEPTPVVAPPPVPPVRDVVPAAPVELVPAIDKAATEALDKQMQGEKKEEPAAAQAPVNEPKAEATEKPLEEESVSAPKVEKSVPVKVAKPKAKAPMAKKHQRRKHFQDWPDSAVPPAAPASAPAVSGELPKARSGEIIDSVGGDAIPALPLTAMESGGIRYVTGGVGDEEIAQLKSIAQNYNVQILLTASEGEFLSDALVRLLDDQGAELLSADHAGPYFYVHLSEGDYMLEVTAKQGGIKTIAVKVPAHTLVKQQLRFNE